MNRRHNHTQDVPPLEMNRRTFLKLCALGAVPGFLAACGGGVPISNDISSRPTPRPSPTVQPSPTKQPAPTPHSSPTDADWSALARSLQGNLIRPDNPRYPVAHQLFNPRFDSILPAAIAYCVSPADVQACLAFVQRFGLPFTPRSGGHSYAGYSTSTGLVLDVTSINTVTADMSTGIATVGAGARLIDVYSALAQQGLALPAGSCPT